MARSARSRRFPLPNPRSCSVEKNQATESPKATPQPVQFMEGTSAYQTEPRATVRESPLNQALPLGVFLELPQAVISEVLRALCQVVLLPVRSSCVVLPHKTVLPSLLPTLCQHPPSLPSPQMSAGPFQELSRELREAVIWPGFQKTEKEWAPKGPENREYMLSRKVSCA